MGRAVWLVGMMGSGKSTVGPELAARLDRDFADSDREIERRARRTVAEIFDAEGEAAFRALEREVIAGLAAGGAVVALGGGAIAQPGAAAWLGEMGRVVYLRARTDTLLARIGDASTRPLLAGLGPEERRERLEALLSDRIAAYESAAIVVDTDGLAPSDVAEALAARLGALDEPGREHEPGGEGGPAGGTRTETPERG